MPKGWIIGQYTGDPYKDYKLTFGSITCAGSAATVVVEGPIVAAFAVGTSDNADVRFVSTGAQANAGTAIFQSDDATEVVNYLIIHKG